MKSLYENLLSQEKNALMWSQQRTAVGSFEMDGNMSGRKTRPSFRSLRQIGYSFAGNPKTPDSKDHSSGKLSPNTAYRSQVNKYGIVTTRKPHTTADGYEIKTTIKLHTPTDSYENTVTKPFTITHGHTETARFMTTRKPHTTNAYEIETTRKPQTPTAKPFTTTTPRHTDTTRLTTTHTTRNTYETERKRKPQPPTYGYEKTTTKPFTATPRLTDTTRLTTTHTTKNTYETERTRMPQPPTNGYEKTTAKPYITTQTDINIYSQPHLPTNSYEKTATKLHTTHRHTDTSRSSDGYKITNNHVTMIHHIGTMEYSKPYTDTSKMVSSRKPHRTVNAYEIETTRKPHQPTYGYEKTSRKPHPTTHRHTYTTKLITTRRPHTTTRKPNSPTYGYEKTTAKQFTITHPHTDMYTTRLKTTRKLHTTTNTYEIGTTQPQAPTNGYETTTAKPHTSTHSETSTLSQQHTPTYDYEKTATKPHTPRRHTDTSRSSNGYMGNDEYDWWLYDTTASAYNTGSVNGEFSKSAKSISYATGDAMTGYYSKSPITWYGASSKSNTEYQVQGPSPTVKTKFGHNSRGSQGFTEVNANGFRI